MNTHENSFISFLIDEDQTLTRNTLGAFAAVFGGNVRDTAESPEFNNWPTESREVFLSFFREVVSGH
jgi:hypothetical protein